MPKSRAPRGGSAGPSTHALRGSSAGAVRGAPAPALYAQALAAHREGRADAAARALHELLARWPQEVDALSLLGAVEAQRNRHAEAEAVLRQALALQPERASLHNNLGNTLAAQGQADAALACFERSLALRPGHGPTWCNVARLLQKLGRIDEALAAADAALAAIDGAPAGDAQAASGTQRKAAPNTQRKAASNTQPKAASTTQPQPAQARQRQDALMLRAGLLAEQARRLPGDAAASARAVQAYREAEAQGAEPGLVRYALAALGDGATPPTSPAGYVRQLFDQYAPRFDEHLRDRLHYRTPELLVAAALAHALGTGAVVHAPGTGAVVHAPGTGPVTHAPMPGAVPQPSGLNVLDLGCGTGLCGPLLRPAAARLVGVDLSPKMLEQAQGRGYDELVCAEAVAYLLGQPAAFDLVLAADVVVYIGDLQPLFAAVWRALRPGGVFALSTELHTGEGFVLQPSRRYGHGLGYVDAVAQAQGFAGVARQREVLRQEHGTPVEGLLHVLRRAD